jgi:hypothetical protein
MMNISFIVLLGRYMSTIFVLRKKMILNKKSRASMAYAGACFAVLALAPALAAAQSQTSAKVPVEVKQSPVKENMNNHKMVVRDSVTGELRAPTPEEAAAMQAKAKLSRPANATVGTPMTKSHSSGAVGARTTDEMAIYAVVKKQADGSLVEEHHQGLKNANAAVKSRAVAKPKTLPTE